MNALTVLRAGVSENAYRSAVATIIRDIQRHYDKSLIDIAEDCQVSLGTISNAVNEKTGLSATYLLKLGAVYGPAFLNPCFALMGAQAAPLEPATKDVLPLLTMAAHTLACARDPESPGGTAEVPQERSAMLKPFKALHRELGGQIAHIETVLA
jgi:hypothetical protein